MQKLKQLLANTKVLLAAPGRAIADFYRKNRKLLGSVTNILSIIAFTIGVAALVSLVWLYVRPIKTADIKVPVATGQATYSPGDRVTGIFFGEVFYTGEVRTLREVFCSGNFKRNIPPPPQSDAGDDFYATQSEPRILEGAEFPIGLLPDDIPVGSNCVIKFTNVYNVQTFFGVRVVEYQYYTQNFAIVSQDRRDQLDCEAAGTDNCSFTEPDGFNTPPQPGASGSSGTNTQPEQNSPTQAPQTVNNDNSTTNNTTNNNPPAQEPVQPTVERCTVDFIIKINCRQVPIE